MDLSHILSDEVAGFPSDTKPFLFNGDFVDRGKQSFEVIMSLLAIKLAAPNSLHLLRGNHETTGMNKHMVWTIGLFHSILAHLLCSGI